MKFGERVNLHTHTRRCRHASGEIEEYCREAVRQGVRVLGFSDHSPFPDGRYPESRMEFREIDGYLADIGRVRQTFPELTILSGLEVDYMPSVGRNFYEDSFAGKFDYLITGTHFVESDAPGTCLWSPGNRLTPEAARIFTESTIRTMESGLFTYLAHPDMFCCCAAEWTPELAVLATEIGQAAKALDIPLEINAYGLRKSPVSCGNQFRAPYPWLPFWEQLAKCGVRVVVGADAHRPEDVWGNTDEAVAFGASLGLVPENETVAQAIMRK